MEEDGEEGRGGSVGIGEISGSGQREREKEQRNEEDGGGRKRGVSGCGGGGEGSGSRALAPSEGVWAGPDNIQYLASVGRLPHCTGRLFSLPRPDDGPASSCLAAGVRWVGAGGGGAER